MVVGQYAKTKAQATADVLAATKEGLNAVIVHPSGIVGPYDYGKGHLTNLVTEYYQGKLTAGIVGGYDFKGLPERIVIGSAILYGIGNGCEHATDVCPAGTLPLTRRCFLYEHRNIGAFLF